MSTFFRLLSLYCRTIYFWPSNQRTKRLSFLLCVFFKNLFSILLKNVMGYFKIASHLKSHAKWLSCLIRFMHEFSKLYLVYNELTIMLQARWFKNASLRRNRMYNRMWQLCSNLRYENNLTYYICQSVSLNPY